MATPVNVLIKLLLKFNKLKRNKFSTLEILAILK